MERREIVKRAITFNNPPRIPMKFDVVGASDCFDVWTVDPTGWTWNIEHKAADEWGCIWEISDVANTGQVHGHPLAELSKLKDYQWPDPDDERRYKGFQEQVEQAEDRAVMFCFGNGIWERLWMLMGMSNAMMALTRHKDEVTEMITRIREHHTRVLRNCKELVGDRIDIAAMADDWGVQDRAFISPRQFKQVFKSQYEVWFKDIHDLGIHTWMHCCGKINGVMDDLIESGLDAIDNAQPNTVGLEEFGQRFGGRICLQAIVDTQTTLPRGSLEEIREQAYALVEHYGRPNGGIICADYADAESIGVTLERRLVMFEAFAEKGNYPNYQQMVDEARAAGGLKGHAYGRHTQDRSTAPEMC